MIGEHSVLPPSRFVKKLSTIHRHSRSVHISILSNWLNCWETEKMVTTSPTTKSSFASRSIEMVRINTLTNSKYNIFLTDSQPNLTQIVDFFFHQNKAWVLEEANNRDLLTMIPNFKPTDWAWDENSCHFWIKTVLKLSSKNANCKQKMASHYVHYLLFILLWINLRIIVILLEFYVQLMTPIFGL